MRYLILTPKLNLSWKAVEMWHSVIYFLFSENFCRNFLYRVDDNKIYILLRSPSIIKEKITVFAKQYEYLDVPIGENMELEFKLRIRRPKENGSIKNWLQYKFQDCADIVKIECHQDVAKFEHINSKGTQYIVLPVIDIHGLLVINKPVEFSCVINKGIGKAKTFGLGLLCPK